MVTCKISPFTNHMSPISCKMFDIPFQLVHVTFHLLLKTCPIYAKTCLPKDPQIVPYQKGGSSYTNLEISKDMDIKNPAYGRQSISRPMRIVARIPQYGRPRIPQNAIFLKNGKNHPKRINSKSLEICQN